MCTRYGSHVIGLFFAVRSNTTLAAILPPPYPRTHGAVDEYIMVALVPHIGLAQGQHRLSGVTQHQGDLVFDEVGHDVGLSVGVKQDLERAV